MVNLILWVGVVFSAGFIGGAGLFLAGAVVDKVLDKFDL